MGSIEVSAEGMVPEEAKKQPLDRARVEKQLGKMGNTPFRTEKMAVEMDEGIFFPMQVVNELRRQAAQKLEDAILGQYERSCPGDTGEKGDRVQLSGIRMRGCFLFLCRQENS